MAYPNDWHETLVAAASEATKFLSPPTAMINAVYTQFSSNYVGALGQTLKINIPKFLATNATDIGRGGLTGIDPDESSTNIVISHKYSSNRKIPLFDEAITAGEIGKVYVAPIVEEVKQKLDAAMAAEALAGATVYPVIVGGADIFTRANLGAAWGRLRAAGAPLGDPSKSSFITHSVAYGAMLAATEFSSEAVVGITTAEIAQQKAQILPQFGMRFMDDGNFESGTAGVYDALAMHQYAYGLRVVTPKLISNGQITQTTINVAENVNVVLETFVDPLQQARYIHAFVMCGHSLVRPELVQKLATT